MPQPGENDAVHYDGDDQEEVGQPLEDDEVTQLGTVSGVPASDNASNDEDDVTVLSGPADQRTTATGDDAGDYNKASHQRSETSIQDGQGDADMRDGSTGGGNNGSVIDGELSTQGGCTLYVRNLPTHLLSEHVKTYFNRHGEVVDCRIVINPVTKESRGFGFVSYRTPEMADRAMSAMDQMELEGRILRIEKARRNRPHDPTPGEYKGPTGASIKYDNRGRLKPGYVPFWDLPVPRNAGSSGAQGSVRSDRGMGRRDSPPSRRSFGRDDRSSHHGRYYGSSGGSYYAPTSRDLNSPRPRGVEPERSGIYRGSPRRPISPSWERARYYPSSYEPSRDRTEHAYPSSQRPYSGSSSSYYVGGGSGGGYYSINSEAPRRGGASRGSTGGSSYGYGAPQSYRDSTGPPPYDAADRRGACTVPSRYNRGSIPSAGGSSRRESSGGYYNSMSAEPSSRHVHRPAGRSRSPPAMRGYTPRQRSNSAVGGNGGSGGYSGGGAGYRDAGGAGYSSNRY